MLDRKFAKSGLIHFEFKKTGWYQTIRDENRHYKYILLRNMLALCLALPCVFAALSLASGETGYIASYAVGFAVVGLLLFALMRFRRLKPVIIVALILPFFGSIALAYSPYGENVNRAILACYPLLAVQLKGTRAGSAWFGSFLAYYAAFAFLAVSGSVPDWYAAPTASGVAAQLASSLVVYGLALYAEIRQDALLGRLSDHFVFDEITGLPGKEVLVHSIDSSKSYLFAIIKIENYSDLVALFGYEFSDTISQFASRKLLKHESRFHYKTYQLKYNEYGILIEQERQMDIVDSAQLLNEVIKALEIESLPWESDRINLVYRVGGALVMPGDDMTPLSKADIALKKAERGHSVITIFDEGNTEKESARDYVIKFTELINNRENGTFLAVFQPIFTGDGLGIAWYEALLRIKQQDGTYTSIYPYLPVAKSTGFYKYLTDFILRRSAEAIVAYDIDISINIAIHDIVRPEFLLLVDEVYEMIRDKKGRIIFEILESDELVELDKCLWFIDYVSRYGFKIAIDDFGTGYSNYCTLINLPIDIVKIDGSLIKKIHHDENAKILVEGIVTFCEKSNKKTVAEFVENEAVMDSLRSMKIDFLQGYYLAKPGHIDSVVTSPEVQ